MTQLMWVVDQLLKRAFRDQPVSATAVGLRVLRLAGSITPGTPATPNTGYGEIGTYKPGPSTTGVLAGTTLTPLYPTNGTYNMATGETLENRDVFGRVSVAVSNATIRNCRVRGRATGGDPLISATSANCKNLLVEDCTLIPDTPLNFSSANNQWYGHDAIKGHDYTVRRCTVQNTFDGFGVFNTSAPTSPANVRIEGNWVSLHIFASPTRNGAEYSHTDGIQVQSGTNIVVRGNFFDSFTDLSSSATAVGTENYQSYLPQANSCIILKEDVGPISSVRIEKNWFYGGATSVNITGTASGDNSFLLDNRFGRNQRVQYSSTDSAALLMNPNNTFTVSGNVYDDNDQPIVRHRGA